MGDRPPSASPPAATAPERFLNDIVDAMADPLFVKDEQHRWVVVNAAFCALMGQSRDEILGKSDYDFFPKHEADTFWKKDEEVFRTGEVNVNEEPFTDAAGETHIIVTKKAVFTDADGHKVLVGTIRDVTEQKQLEQALFRARDELELRVEQRTREVEEAQASLLHAQKMETVGQLTGGVAHDFNNLLAIIMGNLELLRVRCPEAASASDVVNNAIAAAERGATLTARLLAFSRKQALQPRPVDVNALVADMLDLLRRTLGETIEIDLSRSGDASVCLTDPGQLETALINLAVNARDAMPAGGKLTIDTSSVTVSGGAGVIPVVPPGPYVLIEVTDSGSGMPPDCVDRVFEPFFTTKEVGKGSGLGLSMVYGFVKQSHGHVALSSAEGRGTTVQLFLPEHDGPVAMVAPTAAAPRLEHPVGAGEVVLVVEDDPNVRAMTVMLTEGLGYQVLQAGSAREALELVPTLAGLDLLLTDVVLAGGSGGPEVAEEILGQRPEARVLFMSGYAADALGAVWRERGYQLLHKPFRRVELAHAVRQALDCRTTGGSAPTA